MSRRDDTTIGHWFPQTCLLAWVLNLLVSSGSCQPAGDKPGAKPVAAPNLTRAKRLFEDNFENPESGFPRGVLVNGERDYESGRYVMRASGGPSFHVWNFPHAAFPNCALQVKGRVLGQGTDTWGVRISNYPFHWLIVIGAHREIRSIRRTATSIWFTRPNACQPGTALTSIT